MGLGVAVMLATGRRRSGAPSKQRAGAAPQSAVRYAALPADRPGVDVGPHRRPRGLRGQSGDLLRRHRARRRLEDHQQRHDVRGAVPGSGPDVDRRRRRLADRTPISSGSAPASRTTARARRGATASTSRPTAARPSTNMGLRDVAAHQPHRDRSARQRHRVRRGDRPLFGPGGERGVYKTTDGGKTWKQVLKVDDDTGANDLVMDPTEQPDRSTRRRISAGARRAA